MLPSPWAPKAMEAWEKGIPFRELVENEPAITNVLSSEEIEECFDHRHHMKEVDTIFARAGIE